MKKMNFATTVSLIVVVVLVVGAGSFYGGMKYEQSKRAAGFAGRTMNGARNGTGQGSRVASGTTFFSGQILSRDEKGMTVKAPNGSKIIFISGDSQIAKATTGTSTDLTVGTNVTVTGTTNSDGSITAKMVQIRPEGVNMGPGDGQQQPPQNIPTPQ